MQCNHYMAHILFSEYNAGILNQFALVFIHYAFLFLTVNGVYPIYHFIKDSGIIGSIPPLHLGTIRDLALQVAQLCSQQMSKQPFFYHTHSALLI